MNQKLYGVIVPMTVLVVLVILSLLPVGFSVQVITPESVHFEGRIVLQEVRVVNDYFLPRRYELPVQTICLYDADRNVLMPFWAQYVNAEWRGDAQTLEAPAYGVAEAKLVAEHFPAPIEESPKERRPYAEYEFIVLFEGLKDCSFFDAAQGKKVRIVE